MTRKQYIELKQKDDVYPIIWYYLIKNSKVLNHIPFQVFVQSFNAWLDRLFHNSLRQGQLVSRNEILSQIASMCIDSLDEHFEIVTITIEKEVKRKVIHKYIL